MRTIKAEITFLSFEDGGRETPPKGPPWNYYRPHLVTSEGGEYLGVQFIQGPPPSTSLPGQYILELMYENIDYSSLVPGCTFDVKEGGKTVARGLVILMGAG